MRRADSGLFVEAEDLDALVPREVERDGAGPGEDVFFFNSFFDIFEGERGGLE